MKLADGTAGLIVALIVILLGLLANDDQTPREATELSIDPDDPFWAAPPVPESEWDEDTADVSEDTDTYLYGDTRVE